MSIAAKFNQQVIQPFTDVPAKTIAVKAFQIIVSGSAIAFLSVMFLYIISQGNADMGAIAAFGYALAMVIILDNFYPGPDLFEAFAFCAFLIVIPLGVIGVAVGMPLVALLTFLGVMIAPPLLVAFGVTFAVKRGLVWLYKGMTSNYDVEVVSKEDVQS